MSFHESPLWLVVERTGVKVKSPSAGDLSNDFVSIVAQRSRLDSFLLLTKLRTLFVQVEPMRPSPIWMKEISTVDRWIDSRSNNPLIHHQEKTNVSLFIRSRILEQEFSSASYSLW